MTRRLRLLAAHAGVLLRVVLLAATSGLLAGLLLPAAAGAATSIAVSGDHLVDGAGRTVQLRGVDRSGTEYACSRALPGGTRGFAIFDGPTGMSHIDDVQQDTTLDAMRSWGIDAVRVPLSDACWFGASGLNPAYTGTAYQQAIVRYVDQLDARGIVAILSLHTASTGAFSNQDLRLLPLPDADQGPRFWQSVVQALVRSPEPRRNVLYDVFNEPHLTAAELPGATDAQRWACWRSGGCLVHPVDPPVTPSPADPAPTDPPATDPAPVPDPYRAAGMQSLVNEIRARESQTGSPTRPILLGGLDYANDLSTWLANVPTDPAPQRALVASFHAYAGAACADVVCWGAGAGTIHAAGYPVVTGEIGQYDCGADHVQRYTDWADARGISYLAWTWNAEVRLDGTPTGWDCAASPALLERYDGTPTDAYGLAYCRHLLARQAQETGIPASTTTGPCPLPGAPGPAGPDPVVPVDPGPGASSGAGTPDVPAATPGATTPAPVTTLTTPRKPVAAAPRTARITARSLRLRSGRVGLTLSCPKGSTPCRGGVRVRTAARAAVGRHRGTLVVLTGAYDLRPGRAGSVRLRTTADGRALLRRRPRLAVAATATSTGAGPRTVRLTLTR
ncbi:cellulase family glycosylhydrolase [Patulibacter sp. NPDC049589]|uniref:glycoside hydrolase family 5 protein n=1 Tax=Patulibacter sp. NPDC049589 TaxID=3154731 RepID=UPI00343A4E0D